MSSDEAKRFRDRLRMLREAKGLTQGQLDERLGKENNYITRVENGRIDTPPLEALAAIAEALEVPMSELFFFEGVDDNAEALRARIHSLVQTDDIKRLRKYFRLMIVSDEK